MVIVGDAVCGVRESACRILAFFLALLSAGCVSAADPLCQLFLTALFSKF